MVRRKHSTKREKRASTNARVVEAKFRKETEIQLESLM